MLSLLGLLNLTEKLRASPLLRPCTNPSFLLCCATLPSSLPSQTPCTWPQTCPCSTPQVCLHLLLLLCSMPHASLFLLTLHLSVQMLPPLQIFPSLLPVHHFWMIGHNAVTVHLCVCLQNPIVNTWREETGFCSVLFFQCSASCLLGHSSHLF